MTRPQDAPEDRGKRMTREEIEAVMNQVRGPNCILSIPVEGLCRMALLALEAAECLEFYGAQSEQAAHDYLADCGAKARLMLQKLRGGT